MVVPVSATLAANEAMTRRRAQGLPVLPLAFGEAGLPVHPALTAALTEAAGANAYGPVAGATCLRLAAAGYWSRRNLPTDPGLIVAGPGSKPLLYGLLLALGGDVALAAPSWVSYAAQVQLRGGEPLYVPTAPGQGGVPEPELLAEAVARARAAGRDVRAVVVTLPDNPTGTVANPSTIRALCEVAREHDLAIISDEIYRDLVFDPTTEVVSPAEIAPERTFVTTGLSKNLALGGWRIGVARLPDSPLGHEVREHLLGVASEIWSSPANPVQQAAAFAFDEPVELMERVAQSIKLHAAVSKAVAARFVAAGAQVAPPQAGFYCYPDFGPRRAQLAEQWSVTTSSELCGLLLDRYGVGVLAGSEFGDEPRALRFRVATSLLYGEQAEDRLEALASSDPASLPQVTMALQRLDEVFADLFVSSVADDDQRDEALATAHY